MIKKYIASHLSLSMIFTILTVIMTISIPTSFNVLKTFSDNATVSLSDYVNNVTDGEDEDASENPPLTEIEEVEKEILALDSGFSFVLISGKYIFSNGLPSFISSYIFSIFIPPSHEPLIFS